MRAGRSAGNPFEINGYPSDVNLVVGWLGLRHVAAGLEYLALFAVLVGRGDVVSQIQDLGDGEALTQKTQRLSREALFSMARA